MKRRECGRIRQGRGGEEATVLARERTRRRRDAVITLAVKLKAARALRAT
jgi:hypothetical protein